MGHTADVVGERPLADAPSRRVVTVDVVEDFVGFDVAVVIRQEVGFGIPIQFARHKTADHRVMNLEGLMNRRGHVEAAGTGFEVVNVERHGIDGAVPAHDVEGMVVHAVFGETPGPFEPDFGAPFALSQICGAAEIAFTVRRHLQ